MVYKFLVLLILVVVAACKDEKSCVNCQSPNVTSALPQKKSPSIVDIVSPKDQLVRFVNAEFNIESRVLKIENLGWCKTNHGQVGELKNEEKCAAIFDYSKIQFEGNIFYIYRELGSRKPFEKLASLTGLRSKKSASSKKWDEAYSSLKNQAVEFSVNRSLSLKDWMYQLKVVHKLQTSRCKSSKYHAKAKRNPPHLLGNRLFSTDNIFYLDNLFNILSPIEIDLTKERIVGFPVLLASHELVYSTNWNSPSNLKSRNNEIVSYESDRIDDVNPFKILNLDWFYTNCAIYYDSLVDRKIKNYRNPSLIFFPTHSAKFDGEISREVDRVIELIEKSPYTESTDYREILSREEVDKFIPAKENLPLEVFEFLNKGDYEVFSLEQFTRGL